MKLIIKKGTTSKRIGIFIQDSSSTTGAGLTGLTNSSPGLAWYYWREDEGDVGGTSVSIVSATRGSFTSGGFKEKDATNMPGFYELGIPNAALASGANWTLMILRGATNMMPIAIEIELVDFDVQDGVRMGLSALPNATPASSGGLPTVDSNNAVKIQSGTGANQISLSSGKVSVSSLDSGIIAASTFAAGAIDAAAIANGAIDAATFAAGAIDAAAIANGAIDAATFAAGAIDAAAIANGAIDAATFAAGAIDAAAIAPDAIGSSEFSQAAADKVWASATRALTDKAGFSLSAADKDDIIDRNWDESLAGHNSNGSFGQRFQIIRSGTAQGGSSSAIILDSGASSLDNFYNFLLIHIVAGTGAGQTRIINLYTGATKEATVFNVWGINPDSTSIFTIYPNRKPGTEELAKLWDSAITGHTFEGTFGEAVNTVYTTIGTTGAGLTAIPWNSAWDSEVQSESEDALVAFNLDHLVGTATGIPAVPAGTYLDQIMDDGSQIFDRSTDSLQAIRDRGDAAWTTGGGGSITDILNIIPSIPPSIDLANTATWRLGLMLTNSVDDLPTSAEISPGTISIDRKPTGGTTWSSIVADAACSESAGLIYFDEIFDAGSGYSEGDSIRIIFKNQKITVAANDFEISDATGRIFYSEIRQNTATATALATAQADLDDIQSRLPASLIGGKMDSSVEALAAGIITAAAIAPDAIGSSEFSQAAADKVWASATRALTDKAGFSLSAAGIQAIWDILSSSLSVVGSIGKRLVDNVDTPTSTRSTITQAQVNAEVLDVLNSDTFGELSGPPAATSTIFDKIRWIFMIHKNKSTATGTQAILRNDSDTGNVGSSSLADDGTTFISGKWS